MRRPKIDPLTGERMIDPATGERVYEDTAEMSSQGMGREAQGAFGETPEVPQAAGSWLDRASVLQPSLRPLAQAAGGAVKFAGNVAQSLSTGPINAVAQAVQDKEGVGPVAWQATKNLVKSTINPFVPGPNPIQSTEKTLERAGVPNEPRESANNTPGFLIKQWARNYENGYTPEDAEGIEDDKVYPRPTMQPGWAREIGTATDVLAPTWGAGVAAKVASKTVAPALKATRETVGKGLEAYGLDQMKRVVVPLMRHERKAKKPINEVIFEHGLDRPEIGGLTATEAGQAVNGASPETMFARADAKLKKLSAALKHQVQAGKDAGARVDIDQIIREAVNEIKAGAGDSPEFYEVIGDLDDVASGLASKARAANAYGKLDLVQAQAFKQYAGTKGAWEQYARNKGIPVTSKESVESRLSEAIYHKLNDQIDELAPDGVREINRQISELIPAHQALGWRQLIDNRKAKFSMTDALGVMATAIDPKMAAFYGLKKASQSGTVASKIYRLGELLRASKTSAEKARYIGALKKLGLTDEEIKAGTEIVEGSGGEDVYKAQDITIKDAPVEKTAPAPWKPMEASKGTEGRMGMLTAHNRRMQATQYLQKTTGQEPTQGEIYKFLDQHEGKPIPTAPEPPKQTREFKGRRNSQDLGSRDAMIHTGAEGYPTKTVSAKEAPDEFTLNGETYKRVKGGYDNVITYKDTKGRKQTFRGDETIHMDDPENPFKVTDDAPPPEAHKAPEKDDFLDESGEPLFQMEWANKDLQAIYEDGYASRSNKNPHPKNTDPYDAWNEGKRDAYKSGRADAFRSDGERGKKLPKTLFQDERKLNSPKGQILRRQEGGKALITLFKGKADASTWMHEHAHWLRSNLDQGTKDKALSALKGKTWDRDAEERFARAWERYLYDGTTQNKNLAPAMATMKARMRDIYKDIKGTDLEAEIPEEMRILFDAVLIGNKKVTPKANKLILAIRKAGKQAAPQLFIALRNELNQEQPESTRK